MNLPTALWPRKTELPASVSLSGGAAGAWPPSPRREGFPSRRDAAPLPRPSGRRMGMSMTDLIYGQVHLYPPLVELGLLTGAETREVTLWNATFSPLELVRVNSRSPSGTTLSGIEPGAIAPTGTARGRLTILAAGPAQQDTAYTFVTGLGERSLTITAMRVLLFPFWPDWSQGVEMDYAFDTVITRGETGGEQRRPLAKRPLRALRGSVWGDGVRGQRLHQLVRQGKDRVFGVPVWQEARTVADVSATRLTLRLDRSFEDCWNLSRLCGLVMLHERRSDGFMAASLADRDPAGRTLTLAAPVDERFAAGDCRVIPLFTGILTRAEPRTLSDDMEIWSVAFQELGGSQPPLGTLPHAPADPAAPWLWPHRPDWSGNGPGGTSALVRIMRAVRGGVTEVAPKRASAPIAHRQSYLLRGAEVARLLDGVTALRGRWRTLHVRDPRRAFTLTREAEADKAVLYARDNGVKEAFTPGQRLWIVPEAGASPFSRVLLGVDAGEAGEVALHLNAEVGVAVPPGAFVGREYHARLDTDTVTIRHHTAGIARCELSFCTLSEEES